jgi:hypothetical protein
MYESGDQEGVFDEKKTEVENLVQVYIYVSAPSHTRFGNEKVIPNSCTVHNSVSSFCYLILMCAIRVTYCLESSPEGVRTSQNLKSLFSFPTGATNLKRHLDLRLGNVIHLTLHIGTIWILSKTLKFHVHVRVHVHFYAVE